MTTEPRPPSGVSVIINGQPVDATKIEYEGVNANGSHQFTAVFDVGTEDIESVHIDLLPGNTSVGFAFDPPPEDTA